MIVVEIREVAYSIKVVFPLANLSKWSFLTTGEGGLGERPKNSKLLEERNQGKFGPLSGGEQKNSGKPMQNSTYPPFC